MSPPRSLQAWQILKSVRVSVGEAETAGLEIEPPSPPWPQAESPWTAARARRAGGPTGAAEGPGAWAPASCLCLRLLSTLLGRRRAARNNTWLPLAQQEGGQRGKPPPQCPQEALTPCMGQSLKTLCASVSSPAKWGCRCRRGVTWGPTASRTWPAVRPAGGDPAPPQAPASDCAASPVPPLGDGSAPQGERTLARPWG